MTSLWMGNLEPSMDEDFINRAFAHMGETVVKVRVIRDKITGRSAGYGFVEMTDETSVERCLRKVNGKPLPGAAPPKRFKLSRATYGKVGDNSSTFNLFVSDLTPDVDDGMLYEFFHFHFPSCCSGKIILDTSGYSKCCGFVSFESEVEQRRALVKLQGASGLGMKPLRLKLAECKGGAKRNEPAENQSWQFVADTYNMQNSYLNMYQYPQYPNPDTELNVMEENERYMSQSEELYSALTELFFQPPESWDGVTCSVTCYLPEPL
ncbi:hypothetical protein DNTS_026800 [Danionella cerebrum]|uniref:tRNA selenocysteine 1-associated protein 1 n=1 Tax=Danionella cerebrum TaxID=2873325 RepID=A0A553R1B4_9TELE|nr:hypothetical protein DNTS_026800 [Danionella translucida]